MSDVHEAARREFGEWALARIAAHNDVALEEVEFCWNDGEPFASVGKATVDLTESLAAWQALRAALDAGRSRGCAVAFCDDHKDSEIIAGPFCPECSMTLVRADGFKAGMVCARAVQRHENAPVAPPAPVSPAPQGQSKGGDAPCDPIPSSPKAPLPKSRVSHDGARDDSVASAAPARDAVEDAIDALTSAAIVYGESWAADEARRAALKAEVERARAALVEAVRRERRA